MQTKNRNIIYAAGLLFAALLIFTGSSVYAAMPEPAVVELYNVPRNVDIDILIDFEQEYTNADFDNVDIQNTLNNIICLAYNDEAGEFVPYYLLSDRQGWKDSDYINFFLRIGVDDKCTISIMTQNDEGVNISESVEYPGENTYPTYVYDYLGNSFIESEDGRVNEEAQAFAKGFAEIIIYFLLIFVVLNIVLTIIEIVVIKLISKKYKFKVWHIFAAIIINFFISLLIANII